MNHNADSTKSKPPLGDPFGAAEESMLRSLLEYREELIWVGRVDRNAFPLAGSLMVLYGAPFFLTYLWFAWWLFTHESRNATHVLIIGGCLLPLVLFGLLVTCTPLMIRWSLSKTIYAITDRRVILVRPPFRRGLHLTPSIRSGIYAFDAERVRHRSVKRHANQGVDILFAHVGRSGYTPSQIGFIGLANGQEVEGILEQWFPREETRPLKTDLAGSGVALTTNDWIAGGLGVSFVVYLIVEIFRENTLHYLIVPGGLLVLFYQWLWYRPQKTIVSFTCDGRHLTYRTRRIAGSVPVGDTYVVVRWTHRKRRSRLKGWWIRTGPREWIYLRKETPKAHELAELLLSFPKMYAHAELHSRFLVKENAAVYSRN